HDARGERLRRAARDDPERAPARASRDGAHELTGAAERRGAPAAPGRPGAGCGRQDRGARQPAAPRPRARLAPPGHARVRRRRGRWRGAEGGMRHVIVVEDDEHNAVLFRKVLEKRLQCRVTLTEDPEEVLRLVRAGGVALVIMDVSLKRSQWQGRPVGGVEISRMIRAESGPQVLILLATAHAMRGDAEQLLAESGADDYVAKPIVDHEA